MRHIREQLVNIIVMLVAFIGVLVYQDHYQLSRGHQAVWILAGFLVAWSIAWHSRRVLIDYLDHRWGQKLIRKFKNLEIAVAVSGVLFAQTTFPAAVAHADVMQCPYPATGLQVVVEPLIGQAVGYMCDYPVERNLAHLHAEYGGYTVSGSIGSTGNPFAGGNASGTAGIGVGIGLTIWSQSWRCPDERYIAAPPNGIGAWKDPQDFKGVKCPAVQRAPLALDAPWPPTDPNMVFVVNKILAPGQPDPTAGPPDPQPPGEGGPEADGTSNLSPVPVNPVPLNPRGS